MFSYLRQREGHYYLRLRTPTDLRNVIPEPEIHKSLHTKDRKSARLSASCLLPKIFEVFTLARTGFFSQEQAAQRLDVLLERTPREAQIATAEPPAR